MLYTDSDKNVDLRKILNAAITNALIGIQDMKEDELDSLMSLIPEAAF